MNRLDAIDLARAHALSHGQAGDHAYLPTTDAEAAEWLPHSWVVDAIVEALAASAPGPDERDWTEVDLWAEVHRLRAAVKGPDGYASWQDAATKMRAALRLAYDAMLEADKHFNETDEKCLGLAHALPKVHEALRPNVPLEPPAEGRSARSGC